MSVPLSKIFVTVQPVRLPEPSLNVEAYTALRWFAVCSLDFLQPFLLFYCLSHSALSSLHFAAVWLVHAECMYRIFSNLIRTRFTVAEG
jgi:hypothetical protein